MAIVLYAVAAGVLLWHAILLVNLAIVAARHPITVRWRPFLLGYRVVVARQASIAAYEIPRKGRVMKFANNVIHDRDRHGVLALTQDGADNNEMRAVVAAHLAAPEVAAGVRRAIERFLEQDSFNLRAGVTRVMFDVSRAFFAVDVSPDESARSQFDRVWRSLNYLAHGSLTKRNVWLALNALFVYRWLAPDRDERAPGYCYVDVLLPKIMAHSGFVSALRARGVSEDDARALVLAMIGGFFLNIYTLVQLYFIEPPEDGDLAAFVARHELVPNVGRRVGLIDVLVPNTMSPFGMGGRSCIAKGLSMSILRSLRDALATRGIAPRVAPGFAPQFNRDARRRVIQSLRILNDGDATVRLVPAEHTRAGEAHIMPA